MGKITAIVTKRKDILGELVEQFLDDLRAQNKSPHTIKNYHADLRAFLEFYKGSLETISAPILRKYFAQLEGLTPNTISRKHTSLKSFLRWCYQQELISANPMEKVASVKLPETQPRFLELAQVQKILSVISRDRDRVLFTLISETGLRISEALSIQVEDLRLDAQELRVKGKGQKERTVHLIKTQSLRLLRWFLRKYGIKDGLLFRPDLAKQRQGATGKPLDYSVVCRAWGKYCALAGIDATIHQLRHTYATSLINKGARVEVVSKLLGHSNLQTTQRYAKVSDATVKRALEQIL